MLLLHICAQVCIFVKHCVRHIKEVLLLRGPWLEIAYNEVEAQIRKHLTEERLHKAGVPRGHASNAAQQR